MLFIHSLSQKSSYKLMDGLSDPLAWYSALWYYPNLPQPNWASNRTTPLPSKYLLHFCAATCVRVVPSTTALLSPMFAFSHSPPWTAELSCLKVKLHSICSDPPPCPSLSPFQRQAPFSFPSHVVRWHSYWDSHMSWLWALSRLPWPASRIDVASSQQPPWGNSHMVSSS